SIEDNLLKLDILGHDDPTMLRMLQDLSGIDPTKLPLDDPGVMEIFSSTKSLGVTERSEEHTSELQSRFDIVCRLLLEKKKINYLTIAKIVLKDIVRRVFWSSPLVMNNTLSSFLIVKAQSLLNLRSIPNI